MFGNLESSIGLVKEFNLFSSLEEVGFIQRMLDADIRNNSVWNYCFFIYMRDERKDTWDQELERAKEAIRKVVNNESPWMYLRG